MALDLSPENLREEVERAEQLRDKHTQMIEQLVLGYTGAYYRRDHHPDEPTPENHAFEYVSLMLPLLAYDNPSVAVSSTNAAFDPSIAVGMEEALNQTTKNEDLQKLFERVAYDCLFGFGVLITTLEETTPQTGQVDAGDTEPEEEETPPLMLPRTNYLSPDRFFIDPLAVCPTLNADGFDGIRFMGHRWVRDLEDLKSAKGPDGEPLYDLAALEQLETDVGLQQLHRPDRVETPTRREIVGYEVWVPPSRPDPYATSNGTIYTLAVLQDPQADGSSSANDDTSKKGRTAFIRKPRPYFGPAWGPYTLFGIYEVPGQCYPLGPIAAVAEQAEELNAHAHAAARAAGREKSITLVNSTENAAASAVKNAKDGEVWKVPNLNPNSVQQLELGGVNPARYEYMQALRERLDRNSGINDARRGNVQGKELATAIHTANDASKTRESYIQAKFQKAAAQVMKTRGWYLFHSENVVIPLSADAGKRLNMRQPVYHGGIHEGQENMPFDSLALSIEPYSMERPNEAMLQQRTMTLLEWLLEVAEKIPALPFLQWEEILDLVGRVFNTRTLSKMVNVPLLQKMWQAAMQPKPPVPQKTPVETLNYKDAPADIQRQIEAQAGLQPSRMGGTVDQTLKAQSNQLDAQAHQLKAADLIARMHSDHLRIASDLHKHTNPNTPAPEMAGAV
jgi:hypothetical protein